MRDVKGHLLPNVRDDYQASTYGDMWAGQYDDFYADLDDSVVDFLASLADPPKALELAIGTGRIALPLMAKGVAVTGIDVSSEMVAKLKAKAGGEAIEVVMGDMAKVDVDDTFPLIYLAFNTIFALLTQETQVECFRNVSSHLEPGGQFVIDCFVPDVRRFDSDDTRMGVSSISSNSEHVYEMSIHNPQTQRITSHVVRRHASGVTDVLPIEIRYAWPSELDLMAQLGGLELEDRWGWYDRRRFTESSGQHVSVYRKPL